MINDLQERINRIKKKAENQRCCDCFDKIQNSGFATLIASPHGEPVGAFFCYACSRAHKSLGSDNCYVLDTRMTENWAEEEVEALERGGNKLVNAMFEGSLGWDCARPSSSSDMTARKSFCHDKYVERKFFSVSVAKSIKNSNGKPVNVPRISLKSQKGSLRSPDTSQRTLQESFSSGEDDMGEIEGLGYGEAGPDSSDRAQEKPQSFRRRASRRRASLGSSIQTEKQLNGYQVQLGCGDPTAGSDKKRRERRPRRRASLGYAGDMPQTQDESTSDDLIKSDHRPRSQRMRRRGSLGASDHGRGPPSQRRGGELSVSCHSRPSRNFKKAAPQSTNSGNLQKSAPQRTNSGNLKRRGKDSASNAARMMQKVGLKWSQ